MGDGFELRCSGGEQHLHRLAIPDEPPSGRRGGESVDYAIALRIRPKLMTAIGAILALMPLALGLGMGAQMQQPLAVAVIGGFVVGLPQLLVVLPVLMRRIAGPDRTRSMRKCRSLFHAPENHRRRAGFGNKVPCGCRSI